MVTTAPTNKERPGRGGAAAREPGGIAVLYEDAWYVVVDKPAGLLVHATWQAPGESDCAADRAAAAVGAPRLWPVPPPPPPESKTLPALATPWGHTTTQ